MCCELVIIKPSVYVPFSYIRLFCDIYMGEYQVLDNCSEKGFFDVPGNKKILISENTRLYVIVCQLSLLTRIWGG